MPISLIPNKKRKGKATDTLTEARSYITDFLPALAVLGIVVGIYIGTSIWFSGLKAQYDELEIEKERLESATERSQTPEIRSFVSRARALGAVIDEHVVSSETFKPFEDSIHPQITITEFRLEISDKRLAVGGEAPDFEVLGEQFVIWKDETMIFNEVDLGSFERNEEGIVTFSAELDIKEDYLR